MGLRLFCMFVNRCYWHLEVNALHKQIVISVIMIILLAVAAHSQPFKEFENLSREQAISKMDEVVPTLIKSILNRENYMDASRVLSTYMMIAKDNNVEDIVLNHAKKLLKSKNEIEISLGLHILVYSEKDIPQLIDSLDDYIDYTSEVNISYQPEEYGDKRSRVVRLRDYATILLISKIESVVTSKQISQWKNQVRLSQDKKKKDHAIEEFKSWWGENKTSIIKSLIDYSEFENKDRHFQPKTH